MPIRFYNSLSRSIEEFNPIRPGRVGMYTCGPTVYNYAHIGNYRAYMFEDLLRRTLKFCGFEVRQVMNLTDVDDKTIRGSREAGLPLDEYTRKYKDAFFEDIGVLRIEPAEVYPEATRHIDEMIGLVEALLTAGVAYRADDGSVYFSISRFPRYGQLARIALDPERQVARVRHDEYAKESIADFALWKAWDEADGDVAWESPWGRGRPGWHIECSAMSMRYLGKSFDIHTGGVDNLFPHHEDEIAQSEAATGRKFVNYWLHCAHLMVDGRKMSKSLGNFYTLRDVLDRGFSGREVRWELLRTHYRQTLNFTFQGLRDARVSLNRLDEFVTRLKEAAVEPNAGRDAVEERCRNAAAAFLAGLEDDLNISAALAALFDLVRDVNRMIDAGECRGNAAETVLGRLRDMDRVLGVLDVDRSETVPGEIQALVDERQAARKARDYARADAIRDELTAKGWTIEDTPKGPRVKRA
ncbi:MAG: cysteine--tRNA ligase [Kiritimatiellaeota bacterium]|nr:cysteine--tRNA ligase [Kiritimatiellota bacterium]